MACDCTLRLFSVNVWGLPSKLKRKSVFTYFRERKYDIICLQETYITKDVSDGWEKEWGGKLISNDFPSHSSGQVILFRKGVIKDVNIVYNSRRILITKFEIVSNQIAVVNAPARSQEKMSFFDELADAIKNINVDYIVVCGDFNCVLKSDLDIISGEKLAERVVLKFNDLLSDCDLHDTWRLFHPEDKEYTWRKKNPFVARRLH